MNAKHFLSIRPFSADLGLLILRLFAGGAMLTHGFPKFLKVLEGNFQFGDPIGIGPEASLILAAFAEFVCSILLIFGITTRIALVPLIITMLVAFFVVLGADDFSSKELPFFYLGIYASLFLSGPGKYSLDKVLFEKEKAAILDTTLA